MRNLAARIERLEQVQSPAHVTVIMITNWGEGQIKGWKGEGFYIARNPGESEEALACRAAAEARAHYGEHLSLVPGHIVLHMEREDVPHVKAQPRPELIPEARPAPKAQAEQTEITVIRDWMT